MNKIQKIVLTVLVYCLLIACGTMFIIEFLNIHEMVSMLFVMIIMLLSYVLTLIEEQ